METEHQGENSLFSEFPTAKFVPIRVPHHHSAHQDREVASSLSLHLQYLIPLHIFLELPFCVTISNSLMFWH